MENLCENALFTGYDLDGGYAEFAIFREEAAYPIPEGYTNEEFAPLLCGGVIGYRAYRQSKVKEGEILGLFGFGSSAHLVAQMALFEGVRVFVFTRSPEHQKLARELGASFVGRAEDVPPEKLDAAIIFAPAGHLVRVALEYLCPGGRVITAGIYSTPIPELPYDLIYKERCIQSVANSTRKDVQELIELSRRLHFKTQIEVFPLEEANRALLLLKESKIRASAVLSI
jgi:propanol-preferring alcohol dehydrogenase